MSYRTVIENEQIFGNNEYYSDWIDFVKSNGIVVDEDDCYEGDITDVEGMFKVIDRITRKIIADQHERVVRNEKTLTNKGDIQPCREMTDFSDSIWLSDNTPLLMSNRMIMEESYFFIPYILFNAVKGKIVPCEPYKDDTVEWYCCSFKIKDGEKIHIRAS